MKYGIGMDKYGNMYSSISKARLALETTQARLDSALETNRRLEQGREEIGRKQEQLASLEEKVAQVSSRVRGQGGENTA